ncbi:MAG: hypothetical protein HY819_12855 [Acidobacteria bacterium]|nr:hypothetical protein [Acidobacteriota bacterium]
MRLKFLFHKHTWSTPHQVEGAIGRYVMRCYDCGAERAVEAQLEASSEIENRIKQARAELRKLNKVS